VPCLHPVPPACSSCVLFSLTLDVHCATYSVHWVKAPQFEWVPCLWCCAVQGSPIPTTHAAQPSTLSMTLPHSALPDPFCSAKSPLLCRIPSALLDRPDPLCSAGSLLLCQVPSALSHPSVSKAPTTWNARLPSKFGPSVIQAQ